MSEDGATPGPRQLAPLTAAYEETQHGAYVQFLCAALKKPGVHNVALTGGYGSGKSSVIKKIETSQEFKVLNVAISSLGNDLSAPGDRPAGQGADLTNRIEKAIVKQLLYRKSPETMPASEFHRLSKFPTGRAALTSAAAVTGSAAVPVLLGWNPDLAGHGAVEWVTAAGMLGIATAGLTGLRAFLHQRFSVSSVGAAGASVTLARRPSSYFDKYLAEIVYFFEVTDYDVVVFEDLDRFENPGIFEALRELNTILNESDQVGHEVRFVYAVRDSVFEKLGQETTPPVAEPGDGELVASGVVDAAQAEVERANRTKFFDMVIPLVPFITHRSARDLLSGLFPEDEDHRPTDELIDLVAGHVPDMRMLKNIRNEYCVFAEQLLARKKGAPDLSPDTLLALVLYKHLHLADFEKIIHGRSDLDTLYKAYRSIVNDSIRLADAELRTLDSAETATSTVQAAAAALGERFTELLELTQKDRSVAKIVVGDQDFGTGVSDWLNFWQTAGQHGSIAVTVVRRNYPQQVSLTFDLVKLGKILGQDLAPETFRTHASRALDVERRKLRADRDFLRGASMAALAGRDEFTDPRTGGSLAEVIATLKSELARDLVREGHIDHNFTLYVAQFYGDRLSKNLQTFIVRNVDTNTADANYQLNREEVAALLTEAGPRCLRGASAYNIAILDYLLDERDERGNQVFDRLASFGKAEQAFIETYLSNGSHPDRLSAGLATRWAHILEFLAVEARVDPAQRVRLVDAAMTGLDAETAYDTDGLGGFLEANYAQMSVYRQPLDPSQVKKVVAVTDESGAHIQELAHLDLQMLRSIVEADLYPLTATNLRAAMGAPSTISLDWVREASAHLFEDCLNQPELYLVAVAEDEDTDFVIEEPESFGAILEDAAEGWDSRQVDALVARSSPQCFLPDLAGAPPAAWPALAAHHRFPATVANIEAYRAELGIDDALGARLTAAGAIETGEDADEEVLRSLAAAILSAASSIPDPANRVELVKTLDLAEPLEPDSVPVEAGPLLGLLLTNGLVADTAEAFERFAGTDWPTIESAIAVSSDFGEHASSETLPAPMVKDLFHSATVPDEVKNLVLSRAQEFLEADDPAAWRAAAGYLLGTGRPVDESALEMFATPQVGEKTVVRLAERCLDAGGDGRQILLALAGLGGAYAGLAGPSGGTIEIPYELNNPLFTRLRNARVVAGARRGRKVLHRDKLVVTLN